MLKELQPAARKACPPKAAKPHTCGLRSVFPEAHVPGKNRFHLIPPPAGGGTLRGFFLYPSAPFPHFFWRFCDEELPFESYAAAGVDVTAGYESVNRIKPLVESTYIPGVLGTLGGFGGLFAPRRGRA